MSEIGLSTESSATGSPASTRAAQCRAPCGHHVPRSWSASELVLTSYEWGMIAFLVSEAAFFCTLIVVYLAFLGAVQSGPTPAVLSLPLVIGMTACLLSSSVTVHLAAKSLRFGARSAFMRWWSATILLGTRFSCGHGMRMDNSHRPARSNHKPQCVRDHVLHPGRLPRPPRNGRRDCHAHHACLARNYGAAAGKHLGVELVSWYWHFVDIVWVVVFTVVYLVGR